MKSKYGYNIQEHPENNKYQKDSELIVKIVEFRKGEEIIRYINGISLAFLLKGNIEFSHTGKTTCQATENDFFIIPAPGNITIKATKAGFLMLYRILNYSSFLNRIQHLNFKTEQKTDYHPKNILKMDNLFRQILDCFIAVLKKKIFCKTYLNANMETILIYITTFYPADKLANFLEPVLTGENHYKINKDTQFRKTIILNKNQIFSVTEMANKVNQNRQTFRDNFKRIFGTTPKNWIQQERNKIILSELTTGNRTLQEIADITGFRSERDFYTYCKITFGKTAISIRNRKTD
jgi:AraC-like DNA-binding protein